MSEDRSRGPPRVSVIMPTYDQDTFLPTAVSSLMAQTMTDWELVVDDGSPGDAAAALGGALDYRRVGLVLSANVGSGPP